MTRSLSVVVMAALVLTGCATLSKDECLTADWYQIGYEDGSRGYSDARISAHREACAKHGVAPDFRMYQDGHAEGVIRFCTQRNGFEQGQRGYSYTGICPASLEGPFLDGYEAGREIYAVTSAIRSLEAEQRGNERQISQLQQEILDKTNLMLANETTIEDRYRLNQEISQMQQDLGGLEERNKQLVVELAEAQAKLRVLREKYAYF